MVDLGEGRILWEPDEVALSAALGQLAPVQEEYREIIIIGAGPAGMTAGIYLAREGAQVALLEKAVIGGQAATTWMIENYPGFPEPVSGLDFSERLQKQTEAYGAQIVPFQTVTAVSRKGAYQCISTAEGNTYRARAVLLALGARYRTLNLPGEERFIGKGVHYCATCDGAFYKDKTIAVVGGGNSAVEESIFLTRFARKVYILVREEHLQAEDISVKKLQENSKVEILYKTGTRSIIESEGRFAGLRIADLGTSAERELNCDGIFVFIGMEPATAFLKGQIELDGNGYITTSAMLETTAPGVFAAGDARAGSVKQIASAVGEGAAAALMIRDYLRRT
ncbi:hypothetical protein AUK40_02720 [Candidatus Wirthbacteria bacterium CG2_30_54_11]|uniref:FAD/NAD(P)-binding domain-containing protein n=1 Tax=Candidatus Wirthbacteria bacterium CG2_30_54_11 TaxID=1817892 RepID=A0A1J5IKK2_9BACT|nr:MAG: hypothetical protein AUK40_02720 [Candidatus Wirthbacteria bacterium CG2_30_54_11]